ncbi:MAG: hypothetical protein NTY19_42090 [Planctomycetota bacterium]|nr:hypothetical protein [Planctomycetota bacterium]
MVVAVVFMALGISPTLFLLWWNWWRFTPVPIATGVNVQVKSSQLTREAEEEKPGETALLYVTGQVLRSGEWRDLLQPTDNANRRPDEISPSYVRHEMVYVRPAKQDAWPFALLGEPPVSAWLPAGEYEIMVVYEASRGLSNSDSSKPSPFPLISEHVVQELSAGHRTVVRVPLPHHEDCFDNSLAVRPHGKASGIQVPKADLERLLAAVERTTCVPTPGGVLLDLPEPAIHHQEYHRGCEVDFSELAECRREWTLGQTFTLLDWLPSDAVEARQRLEQMTQSLGWRRFFQGWLWYAAAGISGLVFARWATIAKLTPYQSRRELVNSLKLLVAIFFLAVLCWILVSALSEGPGLRVIPFR